MPRCVILTDTTCHDIMSLLMGCSGESTGHHLQRTAATNAEPELNQALEFTGTTRNGGGQGMFKITTWKQSVKTIRWQTQQAREPRFSCFKLMNSTKKGRKTVIDENRLKRPIDQMQRGAQERSLVLAWNNPTVKTEGLGIKW